MTHHAPIVSGEPLDPAAEPQEARELQEARPRPRHDRWSAPKMASFLRMLSATHSVSAAARSVGMSRQSAYRLRSRLKGGPFDLAWDVAFHHSYDNLAHAALERALNGVEIPVFHKGEQVGSYRKFDERLTVALLAASTQRGNVPVLGRHAPLAERHATRFEALVAEVEAGPGEDALAIEALAGDCGPAPASELERIHAAQPSPLPDADAMAALRGFRDEEAG